MNCPDCGKPIDADQNFCRDCGARLSDSRVSRVRVAGLFVLGMVFAGLLIAMGGKMFDTRWLAYLGLVVMMTGAFIIAGYGFLRETRPRKKRIEPANSSSLRVSVERADTTNKLLPLGEAEVIPSVVEGTTELLKTPVRRA